MTRRRTLLDRLWPRRRRAVQNGAHHADHGGPLPPTRPTRMVVSDGVVFGERIRSFDQAHPMAGLDPRLRLWRDTAAVLVVIAIAIAVSDWLPRPEQAVLSETFAPTQLLGEPQTSGPGTSEPALDSSSTPGSSVDAPSVSPSPGSTPGATPRPTPRPTPRTTPVATLQPSPSASATPAPPTPTPEPPTPTPVPSPPVAVIATPMCQAGSFTISFDGSASTGSIDSYAWDFGDGGSSTEVSPTHDYVSPGGQYTVTLTVTGPGGSHTASVEVTAPCP